MTFDVEKISRTQSETFRPFPGKYPTRICVRALGIIPFNYTGKPIPTLKSLVKNQYFAKGGPIGSLEIIEFDQNGWVRKLQAPGRLIEAPFFNTIFPWPAFYKQNLGRCEHLFLMLDRFLVHGESGKNNCYNHSFYRDELCAPILNRWWTRVTKGILDPPRLPQRLKNDVEQLIMDLTAKWMPKAKTFKLVRYNLDHLRIPNFTRDVPAKRTPQTIQDNWPVPPQALGFPVPTLQPTPVFRVQTDAFGDPVIYTPEPDLDF